MFAPNQCYLHTAFKPYEDIYPLVFFTFKPCSQISIVKFHPRDFPSTAYCSLRMMKIPLRYSSPASKCKRSQPLMKSAPLCRMQTSRVKTVIIRRGTLIVQASFGSHSRQVNKTVLFASVLCSNYGNEI